MPASERHSLPERETSPLDLLTPREREVLNAIGCGRTNRQIGADLGISHRTVEVHRARLMRKLGVRNLVGLLEVAFAAGAKA